MSFPATEGCAPQSIAFTPEYDDQLSIQSIQWDFGDGNTSTQEEPTHIYNAPGTYQPEVSIEFTDGSECQVVADESIVIYDSPEADFTFPGDRSNSVHTEFCFEDQSSPGQDQAPIEEWTWEFDDGDTARTPSPCKTYNTTGSYTISLEVVDSNGCEDIYEQDEPMEIVGPPLDVNFSYSVVSGCPDPVININNPTDTLQHDLEHFVWDFGDGNVDSSETSWDNFQYEYTDEGTFTPTLYVDTEGGCSGEYTADPISNFNAPEADFSLRDEREQCVSGNEFCFDDESSPADSDAPIEEWNWDFADGDGASTESPCKSYNAEGTYNVELEVVDSNGCKDTYEKDLPVEVFGPPLNANFTYSFVSDCPDPVIEITNRTDTSQHDIEQCVWDFGDGTVDSSETLWDDFQHEYTEEGEFTPTLYVEAENGCFDEYAAPSLINEYLELDPEVLSDPQQCLEDNELRVEEDTIDRANAEWTFPLHDGSSARDFGEIGTYTYDEPGRYDVILEVELRNCEWETRICDAITVTGPLAQINDPQQSRPNDTIAPKPFGDDEFPETEMCVESEQELQTPYATVDTVINQNASPLFDYCNPDTINSTRPDLSIPDCPPTYGLTFDLMPSDTKWVDDTIYQVDHRVYEPGDPTPDNPFRRGEGTYTPGVMHDTNLVKPECGEPNYVDFENHSLKFRGDHALDDSAYAFPDTCNRSGPPGASDSLEYLWDFDNPDADSCISTPENPDIKCNYSTEKEPVHLYEVEGCFRPELTVTDTVTGCESSTSIVIQNQPPDAGWDDEFDNMTRSKQKASPDKRTGVKLEGERCFGPNYSKDVNIDDILPSSTLCEADGVWHVFDSARVAEKEFSCADTLTDQSGQDSVVVDSQVTHDWIPNEDLPGQTWEYETGGCKTMGVVVQAGECLDTAWYNDYICLPEQDARFSILNDEEAEYECAITSTYGSNTNKQFCTGEELRFELKDSGQDSLKRYTYTFENLNTGEVLGRDTLPYSEFSPDTLADGHHVVERTYDEPGKYLITGTAEHVTGCELPFRKKINVGFKADVQSASPTEICVGETVDLTQDVNYFNAFCLSNDGADLVDSREYWTEANRPEELLWDMTGDGNIDRTGADPSYTYDSTGAYDVEFFAIDSVGCTTSVLMKEFVEVDNVEAEFVLDEESERLNHCAPRFIGFEDSSYFEGAQIDGHSIENHEWVFGDGRPNSELENPTHVYAENGAYDVTLSVESSLGCKDTVRKDSFVVIEGPRPEFDVVSDTSGCVPHTVTVQDLSEDVDNRLWELGDGTVVSSGPEDSLVELTYEEPGIYELTMTGTDSVSVPGGETRFCEATWPDDENPDHPTFTIRVFSTDELSAEHDEDVCIREEVSIENNSEGYDDFTWYGEGDTLNVREPQLSFDTTGTFEYVLTGEGARCPDENDTINFEVHDVEGDFEITENEDFPGRFTFEPTKPRFGGFNWFFGVARDRKTASGPDPVEYTFDEPGVHPVCMEVISPEQCRDTVCQNVEVRTGIRVPNVFSPTDDGYNDEFYVDILGETHFELSIYNRWGRRVFRTEDPDEPWNGKIDNTGEECEPGTYYYVVTYQHVGGVEQKTEGTVNLFR